MPPLRRSVRRVLRVAWWNLLFILGGLLLIAASIEAYIRLRSPFLEEDPIPFHFVPGVGYQIYPDIELRLTRHLAYWTVQRTNSLGFLDREPIDPDVADESCHITFIGDSFVNAAEVSLVDKSHMRLEEIATSEVPDLGLTTSAFGISDIGQVNQLPFYDGYARHLSPDMVVLVFTGNDLLDNSTFASALIKAYDPYHMPRVHAARNLDGSFDLGMPDPDFENFLLWGLGENPSRSQPSSIARLTGRLKNLITRYSYFAQWMTYKLDNVRRLRETSDDDSVAENRSFIGRNPRFIARAEHVMSLPEYAFMSEYWTPDTATRMQAMLESELESSVSLEAWESTEFGLKQFKRRADHDGVALVILAVYDSGGKGDALFDRLSEAAGSLGIPVISQHDYIIRQGGRVEDARFLEDFHWSPKGHQWAAYAVWEYLRDEWDEECPSVEPDADVKVDWIKVGHDIHTPEGNVWSDVFPKDLNLYREAYASVAAGPPTVRSDWNVHLYDDGVTYIRGRCTAEDVENHFFMHVIPEDVQDLLGGRREIGFQSITFHFVSRGAMFDGKCLASIDLPEYEITRIRTGQIFRGIDSEDGLVWNVDYNFALPSIMDALRDLQQSGIKPDIRSNFDVHIDDGRLLYVKESCNAEDRGTPFFLHVFPSDEDDLPAGREDSGFDNLGFELMDIGGMHDGGCFAAVDLPEYDVASIRTGQVADDAETWSAYYNFGLPGIMDVVQESRQSGREPDVRANFDIFMNDDQLVYVKESCNVDDRDLPFFLHLFPADENDLPDSRQEFDFDNLDFELMQNGGESDGVCFAVVDLPSYDITGIRTGQWMRGESNVWEASIEFDE